MVEKRAGTMVSHTASLAPTTTTAASVSLGVETPSYDKDNDSSRLLDDEDELEQGLPAPAAASGSSSSSVTTTKSKSSPTAPTPLISAMGLKVLILLAVQNSSKNLLMRFVMRERPEFLTSAAVIGSECTKFTLSVLYILCYEQKSVGSIIEYFRNDWKNTILVAVPASAYNLQMTLEYIALANLDAAMFSVLVQTKLLCTATFAALVLKKKLKYIQVISLLLLTVGVMLCNMKFNKTTATTAEEEDDNASTTKGILATLGIALSSGFASVYTEKVIKTQRSRPVLKDNSKYSLAYTQVQLASMSLVTIGIYTMIMDFHQIIEYGLFYKFGFGACMTVLNSAFGGLIVAAVLKYADSVLKGYATAISVILTGVLSMVLFGTQLHLVYFLGIVNVVVAVLLYNGRNLDHVLCA